MPLPIVVADANVVLTWFHAEGGERVDAARAVLDAYVDQRIELVILDLTLYEVGNVLLRSLSVGADATTTVLEALTDIREPTALTTAERRDAAGLAATHGLTFYDTAYAAAARSRGGRLVTFDQELIRAGLGDRPGDVAW